MKVPSWIRKPKFDVEVFLRRLWAMDDALAGAGVPSFTRWWRAHIDRWFRALAAAPGRLRMGVARVGRRGGKSTTWCKLAIAWALYGPWSVPTGDIAVIAFI